MKAPTAATTLATLLLPIAAQLDSNFSLVIADGGNYSLDRRPVSSNDNYFWAGGDLPPVMTSCPSTDEPRCSPSVDRAYLSVYDNITASMCVSAPGGQSVYVNFDNGALQYMGSHNKLPSGSISEPFSFNQLEGTFIIPGGTLACPEKSSFKLYSGATYRGNRTFCRSVGLLMEPRNVTEPVAWQYG